MINFNWNFLLESYLLQSYNIKWCKEEKQAADCKIFAPFEKNNFTERIFLRNFLRLNSILYKSEIIKKYSFKNFMLIPIENNILKTTIDKSSQNNNPCKNIQTIIFNIALNFY